MEKTITPNAPADFTPTLGNYTTLTPFRYWCQKVMPLVYDDSLSYYELLCKVVDYLNKTMEDVETLHDDVTNLHTAYEELQSYVNNYFSTLDVQKEINNKLDNMASSGELYEIIRRYTDPIVNEQNEKINVLKVRMDTFASLPDGSTAGDAELQDIRVSYNGTIYPSAGDAVRGQASDLNSDLVHVENIILYDEDGYKTTSFDGYDFYSGYRDEHGVIQEHDTIFSYDIYPSDFDRAFKITNTYDNLYRIQTFDNNLKLLQSIDLEKNSSVIINVEPNIYLINAPFIDNKIIIERTYAKTIKEKLDNFINSKRINYQDLICECIGDSLTYGYKTSTTRLDTPYPQALKDMLGIGTIYNYGINGTTITDVEHDGLHGMSNDERISTYVNNADIICIMGGTNDHTYNVPIGTVGDTSDKTKYCNAYSYLIERLQEKSPNACIILITSPQYVNVRNNIGLTMNDYRKAVFDIGAYYSIPVLDMYAICGINKNTLTKFLQPDGVHFSQNFVSNIFVPKLARFIENNFDR